MSVAFFDLVNRADWGKPNLRSKALQIKLSERGGKPCVGGCASLCMMCSNHLASGMTQTEISQEFPDLTEEDIRACLAYVADRERKLGISNA